MAFKEDGELIISSFINQENRNMLQISPKTKYNILPDPTMCGNLEFHIDVVFVK